jgi:hypothetical protein
MSVLLVPIDTSQIAEPDRKHQRLRVAVRQRGVVKSHVVSVESGRAEVKLDVDPALPLDVAVGGESAHDEDIFNLQTLTAKVSPAQWSDKKTLALPVFVVTPVWWLIWLRWCRTFVITGQVLCPDGSPVPGAEVRAYDVDFFWWWSSIAQVGSPAITDATGHFTISFRWCCGWWPIWWWQLRRWSLDQALVNKIQPVLKLNPQLRVPAPDPVPSFDFGLAQAQTAATRAAPLPAALVTGKLDPTLIPAVRERLLAQLPHVPELERLRIWPWWPWLPWFDCNPDIIFRATQVCGGPPKVIVDENVFQTRWDIPTSLNVTLLANDQACCLPPGDGDPQGDCALITGVCGDPGITVNAIGGNAGAAPAPVGYADPGGRDRPFSEIVNVSGQFGTSAQADYYEIESTPHAAAAWAPVPPAALLDITRGYFDATQPWPNQWFYPGFPVKTFGGKHLYESRHHYEATHPPANWGSALTGRSWFYNVNLLASLQTAGNFSDGAYDFRIVGYKALPNGDPDLASRKVMDGCGDHPENNMLVLRLDNRVVGPPTPGTVHVNTTEPDCGILAVRLGATAVAPCDSQKLESGTPLEIDFFVTDPDGHLDHYELDVRFDLGSIKNLLSTADVGSFTLTPLAGGPEGPDYSNAVTPPQTAVRPTWKGGTLRLHIDDASLVFPKTCCYLIELTVWKRNIVSCDGHLTYYNQVHYSFTVTV